MHRHSLTSPTGLCQTVQAWMTMKTSHLVCGNKQQALTRNSHCTVHYSPFPRCLFGRVLVLLGQDCNFHEYSMGKSKSPSPGLCMDCIQSLNVGTSLLIQLALLTCFHYCLFRDSLPHAKSHPDHVSCRDCQYLPLSHCH